MGEDKIKIEYNNDGSATVIVKEEDHTYTCNLFKKKNIENKKYNVSRKKSFGNVVVASLLTAIVLSCGLYDINYVREVKKARQEDENNLRNKIGNNQINNVDIQIVKSYVYELLNDLSNSSEDNLEAKNMYKNLYSKLIATSDYSLQEYEDCIREIASETNDTNFSFGIGKYKKYLHAKNYNGVIYFPLEDALPSYSLEEISGDIVITYLHDDITPYVSASDVEEFKKNKEIENYMKSL